MWPKLREERTINKLIFPLLLMVVSKDYWLHIFKICFWCAVYICGVHYLQIPFTDKSIASQVIQHWWLLSIFDALLTGFGLSHASIFSLGYLSIIFLSYKLSIKGDSLKKRKITIIELAYLVTISLIFTTWYFRNGVVSSSTKGVIFAFSYLLTGGIITRFIFLKLYDLQFSLLSFVGLIVLYRFISVNQVSAENLKSVILLGTLCFLNVIHLFITRKNFQGIVWNISGKEFEKSAFSIPFIGEKMFMNFINNTVVYSILICSFLNFITLKMPLFNFNLVYATSIVLFLVIFLNFILFRMPEVSGIISNFEPRSIAKALGSQYWVFEEIKPGEETVQYLQAKYRGITLRTFLYSLSVLVVIVGQWLLFQYLSKDDYLFDYGIIGLILLFTETYSILYIIFRFYHYGKIAYSKSKWKYALSSNKELTIVNPVSDHLELNIDAIIISLFDPRYKEYVIRILNSCKTRADYLKALVILMRYLTQETELSLGQIILSGIKIFAGVFIFSILIFGAIIIIMNLFKINIDLSSKDYFFVILTIISFWIAVSVSIFGWIHPNFLKQLKRIFKKE